MLKVEKKLPIFLAAVLCIFILSQARVHASCGSGLSISSVTLSAASVGLGQSFNVTIVYQQTAGWNQVYLVGAFNLSQTTLQACNTPNQIFNLYTGVAGTGNTMNPPGGNGYGPINPGGTGPATQVLTVTASASLTPGSTYNYIIGASGCDAQCGDLGNLETQASASISITLPPPSCAATLVTEAANAAPNGLFLFDVDYGFVNGGSSYVTLALPPNVTYVSAGPNATYIGGSNSVSWSLGNVGAPQSGVLWALVSVNSGTADGTIISATAGYNSANCGTAATNSASVTAKIPQLTLTKSQSSPSLAAGSSVTYSLDWTATGQNLQMYDSYDNIAPGTSTTGASVPWGFDNTTNYNVFAGPGPGTSLGTWTVRADSLNNNFIEATVPYNGSGSGGNYPEIVRNVPGSDICNTVIVEGDLQIPTTAAGAGSGADAHMVIACNTSQGITLKGGISIDNSPGNLFIQKNNIYPLQSPNASMNFTTPFSIQAGQWYTMKATVQSTGTGTTTFSIQLWQQGNPASFVTLNYTDTFAPQPTCSGGWRAGWQADETAGTDWYSNLKVFGPGPIVNAAVTDIVPPGVTYVGSSTGGTNSAGTLSWGAPAAFPITMFSFDSPLQWWGTVACPGPIINTATMAADSIPPVTSNSVTLTVNTCITTTPTDTPTVTPTNTPSPTATVTPTGTPSGTPTPTATPTITNTPPPAPTATPTPIGLNVWPNPFNPKYAVPVNGVGVLKAYLVPLTANMSIYTVSGELVIKLNALPSGYIYWDGTNTGGTPVSAGIYYYIIQNGNSTLLTGKVLLLRD